MNAKENERRELVAVEVQRIITAMRPRCQGVLTVQGKVFMGSGAITLCLVNELLISVGNVIEAMEKNDC